MNTTRVTLTYKDKFGKSWSFSVYVSSAVVSPTDPIVTGLIAALNSCLEVVNLSVEISRDTGLAFTFGSSAYNTVEDKAVCTIPDSEHDAHVIKVPAVNEADVSSGDRRTIILTPSSHFKDLSDDLALNYTGRGGQALVGITKAYRKTARRRSTR